MWDARRCMRLPRLSCGLRPDGLRESRAQPALRAPDSDIGHIRVTSHDPALEDIQRHPAERHHDESRGHLRLPARHCKRKRKTNGEKREAQLHRVADRRLGPDLGLVTEERNELERRRSVAESRTD